MADTNKKYQSKNLGITDNIKEFIRVYKTLINQLRDKLNIGFNVNDINVYLISYPNSGRTWFRLLIGKTLCEKYSLDESLMLDTKSLTKAAGTLKTTFTHDCSLVDNALYKSYSSKEMFFNRSRYRGKNILLLIRDPRDVMVSYYFQQTKRDNNYQGDVSDFIRSDKFGIVKLLRFNRLWLDNQKSFNDFLILSYEKAHSDTIDSLKQTLGFMGVKDVSLKILESAVKFSEFNNMKKLEKNNYFSGYVGSQQMIPRKIEDNDSFKTRKGKVGGYVDYLDSEDIEYINTKILEADLPIHKDLIF
jgi:Sulfotransferase domain